jgi:hypothetical protein
MDLRDSSGKALFDDKLASRPDHFSVTATNRPTGSFLMPALLMKIC